VAFWGLAYVNQSREQVAGAPRYDPTLVEERYVSELYSHYGYPPYWGTDYHYPGYPYYGSENRAITEAEEAHLRRGQSALTTRPGSKSSQSTHQPVKDIMTRQVEVIHPEATLWEAAKKMASLDVGPLPVCTGEELVGMLTDRDITVRATAQGRDPKTTRVHEVMTPDVIYAFEDDDVSEAARIMREQQIRRLAVLNQSKRLVGIISLGDLSVYSGDAHRVGKTLEAVSEPSKPQR
jgi:CBS domain-containing protein